MSFLKYLKLLSIRINKSNKSGIILIIVLWVLVILSMLAMGLGRKTSLEMSLAKYNISKAKTKYFAWSGVIYAISLLQKDSDDLDSNNNDSMYYCGIQRYKDVVVDEIFRNRQVGEGYFDILYKQVSSNPGSSVSSTVIGDMQSGNVSGVVNYEEIGGNQKRIFSGMQDEERKININAITPQTRNILSALISLFGYDKEVADTIAFSVIDWRDGDKSLSHETSGAEDEHYSGLGRPYYCKNAPFDSREELLLVRGMTRNIYRSIKDYITIFPQEGNMLVNLDTASKPVLQALARSVADSSPLMETSDADSLVDKIIDHRSGGDGYEFSEDDQEVDAGAMALNALERNIFLSLNRYRTKKSNYFNISVLGIDPGRNIKTKIEAIVSRTDMSIVQWKRN